MIIIYPHGSGIAIMTPMGDLPISEVARKDVPAGVPYFIISEDELPAGDRSRWQADFSNPHGYGIGSEAWFAEQASSQGGAQ